MKNNKINLINIFNDDCIKTLKQIEENSVDAIVTDPPYELGFMGNKWDSTGIANNVELWKQCLRVLKHGGYLLSFGGTRTYHRMACAIEDAGFEVRDMIEWVYGSGFPKSHNIGKAVDKLQGNKRCELEKPKSEQRPNAHKVRAEDGKVGNFGMLNNKYTSKGTSEWEGWGSNLKPAHEPICMARKPLSEKTVAENVLKWGTGGINIDESRVEANPNVDDMHRTVKRKKRDTETWEKGSGFKNENNNLTGVPENGRFPANLIHDNSDEVKECFPNTKKGSSKKRNRNTLGLFGMPNDNTPEYSDGGNASRYFKSIIYQPKASKKERNQGLNNLEDAEIKGRDEGQDKRSNPYKLRPKTVKNNHPTVKPIALMEYLIKMVTRENAVVLDPFMGSGTTILACQNTNRKGVGIELSKDYFKIAKERIKNNK